tara:strand:- start:66 stop:305 length:240 start_codon:yes stop_codon:yes gene_type:complete
MHKQKIGINLLFLLMVFFLAPSPAHAYAGPGVAMGAMIVFITVVLTFFASVFLKAFKYIKKSIIKIVNLFKKKKKKSKN